MTPISCLPPSCASVSAIYDAFQLLTYLMWAGKFPQFIFQYLVHLHRCSDLYCQSIRRQQRQPMSGRPCLRPVDSSVCHVHSMSLVRLYSVGILIAAKFSQYSAVMVTNIAMVIGPDMAICDPEPHFSQTLDNQ